MSIEKCEGGYRIRFRPYDKLVNVVVNTKDKWEAKRVEKDIMLACRTGDFGELRGITKEALLRMYRHQQWELPEELLCREEGGHQERLTLWRAIEIVFNYPGTFHNDRHRQNVLGLLSHVVQYFGKVKLIEDMTVMELRAYRAHRQGQGTPNSTCNREMSAISKMFTILCETDVVETNPCRLVRRLSEKSSERQVYLSYEDVARVAAHCPDWFQDIVWIAYFSGMRKGEITGLRWDQVNLKRRMVYFMPGDTKEASRKRVPIAIPLMLIFEKLGKVRFLGSNNVITIGGNPLGTDSAGNPWPKACARAGLIKPWPRLHDLRGTWKVNAMRSGIDYEIREMILGHQDKARSIAQRYGFIHDDILVREIDKLEWNFGETQIWVSSSNR
jgi:integrase